jgi:hypothetical protein
MQDLKGLEMNLQCKLHLPSVPCGIGLAEEGRRNDAHVVVEVGMVENIEGIDADIRVDFAVAALNRQLTPQMHIDRELAWTLSGVSGRARRPVVCDAVAIVVLSRGDVERQAGPDRSQRAERKTPRQLHRPREPVRALRPPDIQRCFLILFIISPSSFTSN